MIKTPSLKSYSNPNEFAQSEQYIQCCIKKIVRQEEHLNNSYFEEDQIDINKNNIQKYQQYIKNVAGLIENPPLSPYLCRYYVISNENDIITLINETSPETLMDYINLRNQNNAPMNEDEIIQLSFSILQALKQVKLLYINPIYIIKKWKITNYIEFLLQQDIRNYLEQEDQLYLAPELLKYLDIELNDCDDFNEHIGQEISAPKAAIYSLGIILLQCLNKQVSKESNFGELLKTAKYSWSLRDLIEQMLKQEEERSSLEDLLQNPLFHKFQTINENKQQQPKQVISLAVFLQLFKNKLINLDWADQFFTLEEIISISDLKEGIYPVGELKSEINSQITQIIQNCLQQLSQSYTLEDLVQALTKIAKPDDTNIKEQEEKQNKQPKQQFLFRSWFKKQSDQQKQEIKNQDMQEIVLAPSDITQMAQVILIKLLSTASEKAFQIFMPNSLQFIQGNGLIWQNLRKVIWPRSLGFESLVAQKEIVQLTLEICEYLNENKQNDIKQLDKDLIRQKYNDNDQIKIIIKGFINQSIENCYIQGMDSISHTLYQGLGETDLATICLNEIYRKKIIKLENDTELNQCFGQKMQEKILLYQWSLQYLDPGLYAYLIEQDFKCETHLISWFSSFYSREFNIENVLKIYDYILLNDDAFEILLACTIMLDLKTTFEIKDSEGMLGCLKNLRENIQLDNCLNDALNYSQQIHKSFYNLIHQDIQTCEQMIQENEYLKERPWEHPKTFAQLKDIPIFQLSIHDFSQLLRESKSHFQQISIDMRNSKDYETACIQGSIFANYDKKKIQNIQLLNYLELRGIIDEKSIYYVVIIYDSEKQNINEIVDYLLKQRIKRLCILKGGIQAALQDEQDLIKLKQKAVLPPWIKLQIDELKKKKLE